jgi:Lon protease-like protein
MTQAPLFTLPNTVLFPGIVLPLHIFEDRYKNLVDDIGIFNKQFILSFAEKEIRHDYIPQKHACLAKILYIEELNDGKKNIVIEGLNYVKLGNMHISNGQYVVTEYEPYSINHTSRVDHAIMRRELTRLVKRISLLSLNYTTTTLELVTAAHEIDHLINKVIYFYLFPYEEQQHMLEERSLEAKFQYIHAYLKAVLRDLRHNIKSFDFPKSFSKKLN